MRQDWERPEAAGVRRRLEDAVAFAASQGEATRRSMYKTIEEKGIHHALHWGFVEDAAVAERFAHHAFYFWNALKNADNERLVGTTLATLTNHVLVQVIQAEDPVERKALIWYAEKLNAMLDYPLGAGFWGRK